MDRKDSNKDKDSSNSTSNGTSNGNGNRHKEKDINSDKLMEEISKEMWDRVNSMEEVLGRNASNTSNSDRKRDHGYEGIVQEFRKKARKEGISAKRVAQEEMKVRSATLRQQLDREKKETKEKDTPSSPPQTLSTLLNGKALDFDDDDYLFL